MIPRSIVEKLVNNHIYAYAKNVDKEFGGILKSITEADILIIEDKNNNHSYIPLSEVIIITERQ